MSAPVVPITGIASQEALFKQDFNCNSFMRQFLKSNNLESLSQFMFESEKNQIDLDQSSIELGDSNIKNKLDIYSCILNMIDLISKIKENYNFNDELNNHLGHASSDEFLSSLKRDARRVKNFWKKRASYKSNRKFW